MVLKEEDVCNGAIYGEVVGRNDMRSCEKISGRAGDCNTMRKRELAGTSTTDELVEMTHTWYEATGTRNTYVRIVLLDFSNNK